jgi:hypothetical protein
MDAVKQAFAEGMRQPTAPVVQGFINDAIMNALAQKKLDEARRTKKEIQEARMKERLGPRSSVAREVLLQRATSVSYRQDSDNGNCSTRTPLWGERARVTFKRVMNTGAYAAFRVARPIIESEDFDLMIIVIILVNCVSLALFRPTEPPNSQWNSNLETLELSLNVIFTLEVLLRCMCVGFRDYFKDPWSRFDFTLVLAGYSKFVSGGSDGTGSGLRALRAMRALRPLRMITRFESLRSVGRWGAPWR